MSRHFYNEISLEEAPHLLIGIDLGTAFTGVATAYGLTGQPSEFLQWDNLKEGQKKIATAVAYKRKDPDLSPVAWGNEAVSRFLDEEEIILPLWMKNQFQEEHENPLRVSHNREISSIGPEKVYTDFLILLYRHLRSKFLKVETGQNSPQLSWEKARVHFLISAPANWSIDCCKSFEHIVVDLADFQRCETHKVMLSLREPQAVIIHRTWISDALDGGVSLVMDIGAGTSDSAMVEAGREKVWNEITFCQAINQGGAYIDQEVMNFAYTQIKQSSLALNPDLAAQRLVLGDDFTRFKHRYNGLKPDVLDRPVTFDVREKMVKTGTVSMTGREFFGPWRDLIDNVEDCIIGMLLAAKEKNKLPSTVLLILAGGVAASVFVTQAIYGRLSKEVLAKHGLPTLVLEPVTIKDVELAVCLGLLEHRQASYRAKMDAFATQIQRKPKRAIFNKLKFSYWRSK